MDLANLHRIIGKQPKLAKATRTFAKRGRSLNHCELTRTSCHFTALTWASRRSMGLFDSDHQIYRNHTNFSRGRKSALNSTHMLNTSQIFVCYKDFAGIESPGTSPKLTNFNLDSPDFANDYGTSWINRNSPNSTESTRTLQTIKELLKRSP